MKAKTKPKVITKDFPTQMTEKTALKVIEAAQKGIVPVMEIAPLKGIELYKALAKAGFPQGGQGNWYAEENGDQKYYIPTPEEIYTQYLADPSQWQSLTDALARVWIENKK